MKDQFDLWPRSAERHQPTLLLASTSALADDSGGEEDAAIRSWLRWGRPQGWRLVIAPRHPEHGAAVAAHVQELSDGTYQVFRAKQL